MKISESNQDDIVIIGVSGRLDASNASELERVLLAQIDSGATRLLVDCAQLDYISSAGLRVLLVAAKRLKGSNGAVVLTGLKESIKEVFDIAGFSPIFRIFPDRAAALAALSSRQ
jgi:anti-anti-sigma factor